MKYTIYILTGPIMYHTLYVTTGRRPTHGANARMYVELWGTQASSQGEIYLDRPLPDAAAEYLTDVFEVELPDLGDIVRLCVRHHKSIDFPEWYLQEVRVVNEAGQTWTFPFNQWLAEDEYPYRLVACRTIESKTAEIAKKEKIAAPAV